MKHIIYHYTLFLLLAIASVVSYSLIAPHIAQAHIVYTAKRSVASTQSVTILVLDMSGSMSENDPNGLRCSAANAFIDLSGPGNFIGVVGLDNNNNGRGGPHNFQSAQVWAQPTEMSTLSARQNMQNVIKAQSHNCRPDNATPTYDALNQAMSMLSNATHGGKISGSVVLLTDGVPAPDSADQINAIRSDLLPQFKQNSWPIDTVALGADAPIGLGLPGTFHDFLSGIANATSGKFYDDGNGSVPGVSALNIAPFFVNIFASRNHRIVHQDIQPTPLNGGTTSRNFSVTDYTNSLDVVVVKDTPETNVALKRPGGQSITQSGGGVFVSSSDPHYVIFSIEQPEAGAWEVDATGSGQFLMDSLKVSGIGLSALHIAQANLTVSEKSPLALGQPLTITANLTNNRQPITDEQFTLRGTVSYSGGLNQYSHDFAMNDKNIPGTYQGTVTIPINAPPGSYEIIVNASAASAASVIANQNCSVRIELFPVASLSSTQARVIRWDPVLRTLYGLPFGFVEWLSRTPLQNIPARQDANIAGQVVNPLDQRPFSSATVTAAATYGKSQNIIPITVVNDGGGLFHLQFPAEEEGDYSVAFRTSGTFDQSHGDFGGSYSTVRLTLVPATWSQEVWAWFITLLYVLALGTLFMLLRFYVTPHPFGSWVSTREGETVGSFNFNRADRNVLQSFLHRDTMRSREARMPKGLLLRFKKGDGIEIKPDGSTGRDWQYSDGSDLRTDFHEVSELRFRPQTAYAEENAPEPTLYSILSKDARERIDTSGESEDDLFATPRPGRGRRRNSYESQEPSRTRRPGGRKQGTQKYEDDW